MPKSEPILSLIVAMATNRVIGLDNGLPWRLPKDLEYFKRVTMGHPIIMGRNTYDSIGRPLPGRCNIVVTRQKDWRVECVVVVNSLAEALSQGCRDAQDKSLDEVMLIGGAMLYEQALPLAQRLYVTEVNAPVEGDAYFPEFARADWLEVARENHSADGKNPFDYAFVVYDRIPH